MNESILVRYGLWPVAVAWLICLFVALFYRGLIPIDETRYLSVAWEMWQRGDLLVPYLNSVPYAHKPPLLFWLIDLSWWLFGVSELIARLAIAVVGLLSLLLVYPLGRLLWPAQKNAAFLAAWVLLTLLIWAFWSGSLMFDLLLTACAEIGWIGILLAWRGRVIVGWLLTGGGMGLGILAKGPVILLMVLPVALLRPFWGNRFRIQGEGGRFPSWLLWYAGCFIALLFGAGIALAWALPAADAGGEAYKQAILWGQTANRVVHSFAHSRPWWWYLLLLPLLLFPWSFWLPLWRQCREQFRAGLDSGDGFVLTVFIAGFVLISLVSGKQVHYLFPLYPALALFAGHALSHARGVATISRAAVSVLVILPLVVGLYIIVAPYLQHSPKLPAGLGDPSPIWSLPFLGLTLTAWVKPALFSKPDGVGILSLLVLIFCYGAFIHRMSASYNLKPLAMVIARQQMLGRQVAFSGRDYKGEFHFFGRLKHPLKVIPDGQVAHWRKLHPKAGLIKIVQNKPNDNRLYVAVWNQGKFYLWVPPADTQ